MKIYFIKTPKIFKILFSNFIWDVPSDEKVVYLTFDDGPTPEITEWTLNQLKKFNAKATFFCIGKNIENNPLIFSKILNEGHVVANHTFNHLNAWKTNDSDYLKNINFETQNVEKNNENKNNKLKQLFRPPYGKIKFSQAEKIRKLGFKIVMWDIISGDFDATISPEKCFRNATKKIQNGSIIVFHDSQKAFKNLEFALPKTLEFLKQNGFSCGVI